MAIDGSRQSGKQLKTAFRKGCLKATELSPTALFLFLMGIIAINQTSLPNKYKATAYLLLMLGGYIVTYLLNKRYSGVNS